MLWTLGTLGFSAFASAVSHLSAFAHVLPSIQKVAPATSAFLCITAFLFQLWPEYWLVREGLEGSSVFMESGVGTPACCGCLLFLVVAITVNNCHALLGYLFVSALPSQALPK